MRPDYVEAYINRGVVYARDKGLFAEAIRDFDRVIALAPDLPEVYFNKAQACEKSGRTAEAAEAYRAFVAHAPARFQRYVEYARQRIRELTASKTAEPRP